MPTIKFIFNLYSKGPIVQIALKGFGKDVIWIHKIAQLSDECMLACVKFHTSVRQYIEALR